MRALHQSPLTGRADKKEYPEGISAALHLPGICSVDSWEDVELCFLLFSNRSHRTASVIACCYWGLGMRDRGDLETGIHQGECAPHFRSLVS